MKAKRKDRTKSTIAATNEPFMRKKTPTISLAATPTLSVKAIALIFSFKDPP